MSGHKHWEFSETDLVSAGLRSLAASSPHLGMIESEKVIFDRREIFDDKKKVVVVSGGGSGHEPLHGGFVGRNLLDVAVAGAIFASPSTRQILSGITTVDDLHRARGIGRKDYLIVVKNYTGDVLHFGLAAERAKSLGFNVELAIVEDDVSVGRSNGHLVGRRGLAGTALVHKYAGGLAAEGYDLRSISTLTSQFISSLVTVGASLDHCSIPGRKAAEEDDNRLKDDHCEIGMGIHNETGVKRIAIPHIQDLVGQLLQYLLSKDDADRSYVLFGAHDETVLLVNNLGGTSNLELYAVTSVVLSQLQSSYGIRPVRIYVGAFVTSLNGNGFSVTLLNVTKAAKGQKDTSFVLGQLDKQTNAVGWNSSSDWTARFDTNSILSKPTTDVSEGGSTINSGVNVPGGARLVQNILNASIKRVAQLEPRITEYDTVAGDGDCGETLLAGAKAIAAALNDPSSILSSKLQDPVAVVFEIANLLEDSMGGTSGGLYSIFMSSLAVALKNHTCGSTLDLQSFASCLQTALHSLYKYTRARTGDKTLIDTLEPFITSLVESNDLKTARSTAIKAAKATAKLEAKFGRASYVSKDEIKKFHLSSNSKQGPDDDLDANVQDGLPDPGAIGLAAIIDGATNGFYSS